MITIDEQTRELLQNVRRLGREYFRPLGLEADRLHRPVPADHPFYKEVVSSGYVRGTLAGDPPVFRSMRATLFAEEASYWDRGVSVTLPGPGLGGPSVSAMGTPEQRERFLGIFRDRTEPRWAAFAMTEPEAGSDVARIRTRARKDGDGWVLNGTKMFCSNAARASWIVVFATIDPALGRDGHRAFVVENPTPGFEIIRLENKLGVRAYETCTFVLDDCRIPADNLLGGEDYYEARAKRGFKGAMTAFNASRPPYAGQAVGIARCAYDVARDFVLENFPAHGVRRRIALDRLNTIRRGIQTARLLALRSAWLLDIGEPNAVEASCAKLYAAPMARLAVSAAMDIVGEAGVARDALLEKLYRDVKILDIGEGTQQVQRRLVARKLVGLPSD